MVSTFALRLDTGMSVKGASNPVVTRYTASLESPAESCTESVFSLLRTGRTHQALCSWDAPSINVKFTDGLVDVATYDFPTGRVTSLIDGRCYLGPCLGQSDSHTYVKQANRRFGNYIQHEYALLEFFSRERGEPLLCGLGLLKHIRVDTVIGGTFHLLRDFRRIQKALRLREFLLKFKCFRSCCLPGLVPSFYTLFDVVQFLDRLSNSSFGCVNVSGALDSFLTAAQRMRYGRRLVSSPCSRRRARRTRPSAQRGPIPRWPTPNCNSGSYCNTGNGNCFLHGTPALTHLFSPTPVRAQSYPINCGGGMKSPHSGLVDDSAINLRDISPALHDVRRAHSVASGDGAAT
ncbi:hypothetical protein LMG1864_03015 [Achromobacter ruhlandii]|nr:hypothetical protein LMG1864_03015 [Achromobacter ruhlandii]